ncbi:hypothetical protein [Clostridium uliginosum]|uniref:Uncharacterized protein n=1 Tax=Clostridium uliginosum TaxID=119641 RepID=A0A1I1JYY0_9CLOT|nr:hypothetical protein [Clostridium uliginosum]SFC50963.1 hypothetical protein SAMN05421842_104134 [Clostridium uliginosum]
MNISKLSLGQKLILIGGIISIVSLFLPWVDAGILSVNGFQQQGYIVLLAFIYPVIIILNNKVLNIKGGIASLAVGIIFMFSLIKSKNTNVFGTSVNLSASGMYIMIVGLIVSIVGIIIDNKKTTN